MRFEIQVFTENNMGLKYWKTTSWRGNDLGKLMELAAQVARNNELGILKIRVVDLLADFDCSETIEEENNEQFAEVY